MERSETYWANLVAPTSTRSLQDFATPDQMLDRMDEAGVDKAVLLGWYWENQGTCQWHNQIYADLLKAHPDRFIAFASCNLSGDWSPIQSNLERCRDRGFQGIGELHPWVQGFPLDSENMQALLAWCREAGWPVNLHVTEPAGHPYRGKVETPFNELLKMVTDHQGNRFILAHWGGLLPFYELNPRLKQTLSHVYYDTAASPLLYDRSIFPRVLNLIAPSRILWGSDYPLKLYPGSNKPADMATFLLEVKNLGLPREHLEAILGNSLTRLLASH